MGIRMTAQRPEIIFLEGKPFDLYAAPLECHFGRTKWRPTFRWRSTTQFRGYTGRWEVFGTRLFLTGLLGMGWMTPPDELDPDENRWGDIRAIELEDLFPNLAPLVFANWVTERLVVATGPVLGIRYHAYQADLASHLTIDIKKGYLKTISAWINGKETRKIPLDGLAEEFRKNPPRLLKWPVGIDKDYLASLDEYVRAQEHALRKPCGHVPTD
jgi:hypothetical protein